MDIINVIVLWALSKTVSLNKFVLLYFNDDSETSDMMIMMLLMLLLTSLFAHWMKQCGCFELKSIDNEHITRLLSSNTSYRNVHR